ALGRVEQAHDAARERRLAAAGLADDAQRLALAESEGDAVDRLHLRDRLLEDDPAGDREVLLDAVDDEELVAAHIHLLRLLLRLFLSGRHLAGPGHRYLEQLLPLAIL